MTLRFPTPTLHRYLSSRSPHRLVDKAMCARTAGVRPPLAGYFHLSLRDAQPFLDDNGV